MPVPMPKASPQQLGAMLQTMPSTPPTMSAMQDQTAPQQPLGAPMMQGGAAPMPRPPAMGGGAMAGINPQALQQILSRQQQGAAPVNLGAPSVSPGNIGGTGGNLGGLF